MKIFAPILLATALLAGPHQAFAQQATAPQAQQLPDWSDADARAVLNARLAALRVVAELTPEQEKLWTPVEAAIRDISKAASDRRNGRQQAAAPGSFLDVLGAIADAEEARGRELRRLVEAARPFVASLSDGQRRRLPVFLGMTDHGGPGQPSATLWLFEEEEG
ncbi:hypothetical protein DWF00_08385 [Bosea caraganae]|uniref:LTXXQ motif family protein n=1 Tax=Bosea caraganae TaxID=2763117 RepID=A0A370LAQ7_9HYPH|nr:hypothetical protein [Bosea caraganae]RDJ27019.1 hypothetical protein DWF00_08385 [Bosea caraganae]RDJ29036.1 hypothetical protein DWE98_00160 [Bosea caraganae]